MADPRTLLHDVLERIDAVVYHHEQLLQWNEPDSDGPIYPQQVERARLAAGALSRVTWVPLLPESQGTDLTGFVTGGPRG